MTYVPRSPRRSSTLKAVVGGGERGRVRDMSTSGLFVETHASLPRGAAVAVVPLVGGLDGERLPAEVARVSDGGLALRFVGLDVERRQDLRALIADGPGGARPVRRPQPPRRALPPVPSDAPVVLLTDEISAVHELPAAASAEAELAELEQQLVELGLRNAHVMDDNATLTARVRSLEANLAVRGQIERDLFEAYDTIEELEQQCDRLIARLMRESVGRG
ncbi:MAG: PilZ domain-containing protein [Deltaproteobacteria bacterium]|nr:PilZ domain-containing protein [Deltaproteobacteria bacterium]